MKISIVTVCLNCEDDLRKTLDSVIKQKYREIEYIVKDGESKDGTLEIANAYKEKFYERNIKYKVLSKKDKGIYDAMNQATCICEGEWVLFLNAGDIFFDDYVLSDIFEKKIDEDIDILYGHTLINLDGTHKFVQLHSHDNLESRFDLGHQSIFTKTIMLKEEKYNDNFFIAGDWDFYKRMFIKNKKFKRLNIIVSEFNRNGISTHISKRRYMENCSVRGEENITKIKLNYFIFVMKGVIQKIIPAYEKYRFVRNNMVRNRG